ncbi:MAG: hypothetical protein N3D17_07275, partial [bacterium]|nr:hypothetical protein [bacterium]
YLSDVDFAFVRAPFYTSILYDTEKNLYICWYQVFGKFDSYLCMAQSYDGINWEKIELNQVWYEGNNKNNILKFPKYPALWIDFGGVIPNYSKDIDAELICSNFSPFDDRLYFQGITTALSKNGIDWDFHFPPVLPYDGDAHCIMWDPVRDCYLITTRSYQQFHIYERLGLKGKRHIAISKSRDLVHWTPMMTVLEPDREDPEMREFYKMYILPYGHGYIGFLQIFDIDPSLAKGPLDVQLVFSRDLMNWDRVGDRKVFVPRGEKGEWDAGMTVITCSPVIEGNELRFWYGGKEGEHWVASRGGMGTGKIRRDGFISWKAEGEGYIKTSPLYISDVPEIFVNLKAPKGYIQVEILQDGKVIAGCERDNCLPLTGDHILAPVRFKKPVRTYGNVELKFYLKDAEVFGFKGNLTLSPDRYKIPKKYPSWW